MKLNTLLLASAATLITSSAFAADLPSKKAAPAAGSVAVCKVGGMTGFTLPGSDTCFSISGRVTADFANADSENYDWFDSNSSDDDGSIFGPDGGVSYRLLFDARSNTDIGVVRSFIRVDGDFIEAGDDEESMEVDNAYIQFAGFTVGVKDSIADIAGTQGNQFGSGWSQPAMGVDYQAKVGGLNLGVELGDSIGSSDSQPDFTAHISGSFGNVGFALAGVATDDGSESGTALLASANVTAGPAKFFAWGGMADGAEAAEYITSDDDLEDATTYGAGVTFTVSPATSISVQGVHWEGDNDTDLNSYGIYISHAIAKNLTIQPEVVVTEGTIDFSNVDKTGFYLRIQRDF